MLQGEQWQGMGEFRVPRHYRQRVRARRRPEALNETVEPQIITLRIPQMLGWIAKWWLIWFPAPRVAISRVTRDKSALPAEGSLGVA